jgi:hypothetical protein
MAAAPELLFPEPLFMTVERRGEKPSLYVTNDQIPLNLFGGPLPVSAISGSN